MLRPIDLHSLEFKQVFRGYSKEQVDESFSKLVSQYESLYQQNQELRERIEELKRQANRYSDVEDTLHETLAYVKQSATEIRETAEQTAVRIIDEAKKEAEWILQDARHQVADEIRQAQEALAFRSRARRKLEAQLRQLLEEVKQLAIEDGETHEDSGEGRPRATESSETIIPEGDEL
ncbi:MAG: DivIVA domain-containing protein [Firmicutes bacterium]|nr:DivIVA domain-containing protein [Bacillota bacterium]